MSEKKEKETQVKCDRCGHDIMEHHLVNCTNGVVIGQYWLVCPTAMFKAKGYNASGEKV